MDRSEDQIFVCSKCEGLGKIQNEKACQDCEGLGVMIKNVQGTLALKAPTFVDFGTRKRIRKARIILAISLIVVIILALITGIFVVYQIFI